MEGGDFMNPGQIFAGIGNGDQFELFVMPLVEDHAAAATEAPGETGRFQFVLWLARGFLIKKVYLSLSSSKTCLMSL
jgi:hypothetical protein